jgi:hypothetical protein
LPALEVRKQAIDQRAVGLVLDRRFQPPLIIAAPDVDFVVAILDDNALDFVGREIEDVLRLARGVAGAGRFRFPEFDVNKARQCDREQNERCPQFHNCI